MKQIKVGYYVTTKDDDTITRIVEMHAPFLDKREAMKYFSEMDREGKKPKLYIMYAKRVYK